MLQIQEGFIVGIYTFIQVSFALKLLCKLSQLSFILIIFLLVTVCNDPDLCHLKAWLVKDKAICTRAGQAVWCFLVLGMKSDEQVIKWYKTIYSRPMCFWVKCILFLTWPKIYGDPESTKCLYCLCPICLLSTLKSRRLVILREQVFSPVSFLRSWRSHLFVWILRNLV